MASSTASTMATICRWEAPEASTNQSVKAMPLRRSRMTTSSAFLSSAARAAFVTAAGAFTDALRSTVEAPLVDVVGHRVRHQVVHAAAGAHALAQVAAGDGQGRALHAA